MEPIEILKEDFAQTLDFIDKCDNHIFQIKNWAIATSSAIIAFSISQNYDSLVFVNLLPLLAFLYLELVYKSFQDSAIAHAADISQRIDKYLANTNVGDLLVKYNHGFGRKIQYPSVRRVFGILRNPDRGHFRNFYVLLILISVGAFFLGRSVN